MTCQQVQSSLSLYLYGELDFAREEDLENHLAECAFCQLTLAREKQWHTLTNSQVQEAASRSACRMPPAASPRIGPRNGASRASPSMVALDQSFEISATRWSAQFALASMLVFIGFASARWFNLMGRIARRKPA